MTSGILSVMKAELRTLCGLLVVALPVHADQIHEQFPDTIDPSGRYVIYSHGLIVEGENPRPKHPQFGVYDFPGIKQALFARGGFHLIAHHRPADTEIADYVATLEQWVRALIDAGVAPTRITLVGFSRGAVLTALAASRLEATGVNTALMAVCANGDLPGDEPVTLGGHFLSIYETTDVVGSCEGLAARSGARVAFDEVAISTGRAHGAFYQPLPAWLDPLKAWIERTNR